MAVSNLHAIERAHANARLMPNLRMHGSLTDARRGAGLASVALSGGVRLSYARGPAESTSAGSAASEGIDGSSSVSNATLAAASLNLLSALCTTPQHISTAKSLGLIRAMLMAYTRHSESDDVYEAFTELVNTVVYESEVITAVQNVANGVARIRAQTGDPAMFALAENELGNEGVVDGDEGAAPSAATGGDGATFVSPRTKALAAKAKKAADTDPVNTIALRLCEDLCLLEAVCNSSRLAGVLVGAHGVPVLVRAVGIIGVIKGVSSGDAASSGGGAATGLPTGASARGRVQLLVQGGGHLASADRALSESLQEEVWRWYQLLEMCALINIFILYRCSCVRLLH